MFDCFGCFGCFRPPSDRLLEETLFVREWYQGYHFQKTVTYEKRTNLQENQNSEIAKVAYRGREYVLKTGKTEKAFENLQTEAIILKKLNAAEKKRPQRYVIDLIALLGNKKSPALLLPLLEGDLFGRIEREEGLTLQSTLKILYQMFKVLAFLKEQKVFHRDIKPENIFIVKGDEIRLADFGLAMIEGDKEKGKMSCGTPQYLSPELVGSYYYRDLEQNPFSSASDMWATACTIIIAARCADIFTCNEERPGWMGKLIQDQKQLPGILSRIVDPIYKAESQEDISAINLFKSALTKMFDLEPTTRLTPEDGLGFFEKKEKGDRECLYTGEKSNQQSSAIGCRQS